MDGLIAICSRQLLPPRLLVRRRRGLVEVAELAPHAAAQRAQAIDTWNRVEAAHPTIHGGFDWENGTDETQNWPFANGVAPLILH